MQISYRKYRPTDRTIIGAFIKALYESDPSGHALPEAHITRTLKYLAKHPEQGEIIVMTQARVVVGYAILTHFWSNEYGGVVLLLDELYVAPDFRGSGIGTSFIEYLIEHKPRQAVAILLEVIPTNHHAKRLYERLGFKVMRNTHLLRSLI